MLSVEQLPDDPALLKDMLVEHHAREAEIQAAVDAKINAAVNEAVEEAVAEDDPGSDGLFSAAVLRPAERAVRSAATAAVRPEDRRDAAGRGERRRGIGRRT